MKTVLPEIPPETLAEWQRVVDLTARGGDLPWEVTCRGVVDGIAMVIHMTRADGRRFVEEAAYVRSYDAGSNVWQIERLDRTPL